MRLNGTGGGPRVGCIIVEKIVPFSVRSRRF